MAPHADVGATKLAAHTATGRGSGERSAAFAAFIILATIFVLSPNVLPRGDPTLSVPTARSLLYDQDVDLSEYLDVPSVSTHYGFVEFAGKSVDFFPWINSVAATPVVATVDLVSIVGLSPSTDDLIRQDQSWIVHFVSAALWSAAAAVAVALVALRLWQLSDVRRNSSDRRRLPALARRWPIQTASIIVGLTTPLWSITSRSLSAHGPATFCVATAVFLTITARRTPASWVAAGSLCALAFWIRPVMLVATGTVLVLAILVERTRVRLIVFGAAATHVAVLLANQALLGKWLPPYFDGGRLGIHDAYAEAVGANLVSPARGLLVFCPQILLIGALVIPSVRNSVSPTARRLLYTLMVSAVPVLILVSAFGFQWWAGHTYGPRFMTDSIVFLLPVALLLSAVLYVGNPQRRLVRWSVLGVWVLAGLIHFQGGWFHSTQCWNAAEGIDIDTSPDRVWSITDPQITSGARTLLKDGPATALWASCELESP